MSKSAKKPTTRALKKPQEQLETARNNHYDRLTLSCEQFTQLEALFNAIFRQCDEFDSKKHLAGIGQYLTSDWANLADCEAEALKAGVDHG